MGRNTNEAAGKIVRELLKPFQTSFLSDEKSYRPIFSYGQAQISLIKKNHGKIGNRVFTVVVMYSPKAAEFRYIDSRPFN